MKMNRFKLILLICVLGISVVTINLITTEDRPDPSSTTQGTMSEAGATGVANQTAEEGATLPQPPVTSSVLTSEMKAQFGAAIGAYTAVVDGADTNLHEFFSNMDIATLTVGKALKAEEVEWGVTETAFGGEGTALDREDVRALLSSLQGQGYSLESIEFDRKASSLQFNADNTAIAHMAIAIKGSHTLGYRWVANGFFDVQWRTQDMGRTANIVSIDASTLQVRRRQNFRGPFPSNLPLAREVKQQVEADLAKLHAKQVELDKDVWAKETEAQRYEDTIVKYWDQMLRPEDDKFTVLGSVPFEWISFGSPSGTDLLEWGIKRTTFDGKTSRLDQAAWKTFLEETRGKSYEIINIEFHQSRYEKDAEGTAWSTYSTQLHVANSARTHRAILKANLNIEWSEETDKAGRFLIRTIEVADLDILERDAAADTFENVLTYEGAQPVNFPMLYDLDRDGVSEVLLPSNNVILRNVGTENYEQTPLFEAPGVTPPTDVRAAVVADFTNDGIADILCAAHYGSAEHLRGTENLLAVILFRGDSDGRFTSAGEPVHEAPLQIKDPYCVTAGDIDADGDLDAWIGQYKAPYLRGQLPTPFYDANDGNPSYLLVNEGDGRFVDTTDAAGLGAKRNRRNFSASLADLDGDNDFDLLTVNDFAGIDVYHNDGKGNFIDVTDTVVDEASNFGMGHAFADYNLDGVQDFYVNGMASTTMRRLNQMGVAREEFPEFVEMRTRMGYGNRMYTGNSGGNYKEPSFRDSVARSGWAWGVTSLDFDSDGDMDIYIANGHMSRDTTKDYCTRFWCHDLYESSSQTSVLKDLFFIDTAPSVANTLSWDGYQKNHLFMNQSGEDFINVAFLVDVAYVQDSRSVASDDFNLDGRPDLLFTNVVKGKRSRRLHILQNNWPVANNWIGVRLQEEPGAPSPVGAKIEIEYLSGRHVAQIVTGESFRTQGAPRKHFGLGQEESVESIVVRWPDGQSRTLQTPAINTYHLLRAPSVL
jgi:hypothetical protein